MDVSVITNEKEGKMKFDSPLKTKSGKDVVELWNEIKEQWRLYTKFKYLEPNKELQITHAKQIRFLQDDLGMKQAKFPELGLL